jgi:DNA-directed RNA polymerase subunit RPC12/RpoP
MRIGPLLQYFCSSCGKILKENMTIELQKDQLKEECPGCGALLIDSLQNRRNISPSLLEKDEVSTRISPLEIYQLILIRLINKSNAAVLN